MPVLQTTRVNRYTGNGIATVFAYQFRILDKTHIKVMIDGVTKTVDVDYTVSGVGAANGGNITFTAAPANGTSIVLSGNAPYARSTDYVRNGNFQEETVDADFDLAIILIQQLLERFARIPSLAEVSAYSNLSLPDPVAQRFLRWKSDLSGLENIDIASVGGALAVSEYIKTLLDDTDAQTARDTLGAAPGTMVATISDLRALATPSLNGYPVLVLGYYAAGDGGGGVFRWNLSDTTVDDGGVVIQPNGAPPSGRWNRVFGGQFVFEWFGAKPNDAVFDNSAKMNNVVTAMKRTGIRRLLLNNAGSYYFNSRPNPFDIGVRIIGQQARSFLVRNYTEAAAYANPTDLATAAFLSWNGGAYAALGINGTKGGGLENVGIYSGTGTSGGVALGIYGTDTNNRPGYMDFRNVVISGEGEFNFGIVIDGSNITTAGSQGMRDISFDGLYVFRCRVEHMRVKNGVHVFTDKASFDDGGLGVTPAVRVTGGGTATSNSVDVHLDEIDLGGSLYLTECDRVFFSGKISVAYGDTSTATNCLVQGSLSGIENNSASSRLVVTPAIECMVKKSVDASIPNAAWTAVGWDQENFDPHAMHNNATNNTRITVPYTLQGSRVELKANIVFDANATGARGVRILKNGVTPLSLVSSGGFVGVSNSLYLTTGPIGVVSGDYFEVQVYQNSGAALNVQAAGPSWFSLEVAR